MNYICLFLYYSIGRYLPSTNTPFFGKISMKSRALLCRYIFAKTGKNINVDRNVYFGNGAKIIIGDNSGIGKNSDVPNNIIIGSNVMIAPELFVASRNHIYSRTDISMIEQGVTDQGQVIMEDDIWIGRRVIINKDVVIKKGSVVAGGSVVTKTFEPYSILGGNPAQLIKSRISNE